MTVLAVLLLAQPAQASLFDWVKNFIIAPPAPPANVGAEENPQFVPTTANNNPSPVVPTPQSPTGGNNQPNVTTNQVTPPPVNPSDHPVPADNRIGQGQETMRDGQKLSPDEQRRRQEMMDESKKRMPSVDTRREPEIRNEQDTRREDRRTETKTNTTETATPNDQSETEQPPRFVDPRWKNDTIRQTNDQQRELKRLLTQAKRLKDGGAIVTKVQALIATVTSWQQKIKAAQGDDLQDTLEEYHETQLWDELNVLRAQVEIPKRLAELEKSLTRTERLLKQKVFTKLSEVGLDLAKVRADLVTMRTTLTDVKAKVAAGNFEEVQEAMQEVFDGSHPGEIEGVLHQMRGLAENLKRIRNQEIRDSVKEIFQPVIDAINDGDYREANELLREMQNEMQRIFAQLYKVNRVVDASLQKKLDALENKIQGKLQTEKPEEKDEDFPPVTP